MSEHTQPDQPRKATPPYECRQCHQGLTQGNPTAALVNGRMETYGAPRTCKACKGTGRTWTPPGAPPV
ncbi:hypothetical protein ACQEU3_46900 [Spirillospora sp. CA-253888]